jgi:hypothetical protein
VTAERLHVSKLYVYEVNRVIEARGKTFLVRAAIRFNADAAGDLLLPLAINSPQRLATECDGIVRATILKMEEIK